MTCILVSLRLYLWWILCTLYFHASQVTAYRGRVRSLLLCLCDVFRAPNNSLVCCRCLFLFSISSNRCSVFRVFVISMGYLLSLQKLLLLLLLLTCRQEREKAVPSDVFSDKREVAPTCLKDKATDIQNFYLPYLTPLRQRPRPDVAVMVAWA